MVDEEEREGKRGRWEVAERGEGRWEGVETF
jgi:hypothetical protein